MSFGFESSTEELHCIEDAIGHAHKEGTVLFAAARNNGGLEKIAYPASHDDVICINSTDGVGNPSLFNPSYREGKNFSTVGEAVLSSWLGKVQQRKTGTSYATPIAAGIAAVAMDYMEHKRRVWSKADDLYLANKIKTRKGIVTVFNKHLSYSRNDFRFLCPWRFFKKDASGLDGALLQTLREVF